MSLRSSLSFEVVPVGNHSFRMSLCEGVELILPVEVNHAESLLLRAENHAFHYISPWNDTRIHLHLTGFMLLPYDKQGLVVVVGVMRLENGVYAREGVAVMRDGGAGEVELVPVGEVVTVAGSVLVRGCSMVLGQSLLVLAGLVITP
ncbi:uncharacterized protein LOC127003244 [Eriocheir sinensis]|uniref:uncharacterized protein LOC127003244 n=1 Tax=Eriocheir sinensis TaxID=95602 RepID=UPI0021CA54B2|nr:uncharacterized protein LOC127003244 [Eriocheir sinensis]